MSEFQVKIGEFLSSKLLSYRKNPDTGKWESETASENTRLTNALVEVVSAFEDAVLARYGKATKKEVPVTGTEGLDFQIQVSYTQIEENPTDGRMDKLLEIINGDIEFTHQLILAVRAVPYAAWSVTLPKLAPSYRQFWATAVKKYAPESHDALP